MSEATRHNQTERIVNIDGQSWLLVTHSIVIDGKRLPVGVQLWSVPPFTQFGEPATNYYFGGGKCEGEDGVVWPGQPEPITSKVIRDAKLSTRITGGLAAAQRQAKEILDRKAKYALARAAQGLPPSVILDTPPIGFLEWQATPLKAPPGRPPKYGDDHYRQVAKVYEQAASAGKAPTPVVARECKGSTGTAERWIREARRRGFLGETNRTKGSTK